MLKAFFELRANGIIIQHGTAYVDFCINGDQIMTFNGEDSIIAINETEMHIVVVEPIITEEAKNHVHHFTLLASESSYEGSGCDEFQGMELTYVWAPGDLPLVLPPNVGTPLGVNGFKSFRLQIHYDNPERKDNIIDNSGVRLYYTSKKREFDLGVFQTGDPLIGLFNQPTVTNETASISQHVFDCPSTCTEENLPQEQNQPITVIREHLHMHKTGISMKNDQLRNDTVIRTGAVDYWDFNQQGNFGVIQEPFQILPGDGFRTTCTYSRTHRQDKETVFGLASDNEMCIAFLFYYPRVLINRVFPLVCGMRLRANFMRPCRAQHVEKYISSTDDTYQAIGRTFGAPPSECRKNAVEMLSGLDSITTVAPTTDIPEAPPVSTSTSSSSSSSSPVLFWLNPFPSSHNEITTSITAAAIVLLMLS